MVTMHQINEQLLNQLAEMPHFLNKTCLGTKQSLLLTLSSVDKSPLNEHLWHLLDCETDLYGMRIRRVINEEQPVLEPMSVSHWPVERDYPQRLGDVAIERFCGERAQLIALLGNLSSEQTARTGIRPDGSIVTIADLLEQVADHDRDHRWRIAAIYKSFVGLG